MLPRGINVGRATESPWQDYGSSSRGPASRASPTIGAKVNIVLTGPEGVPRDEVGIGEAVGGLLLSDFGVDVTCFTRAAEAMIAVHDLDPLGTWRPTRPAHS